MATDDTSIPNRSEDRFLWAFRRGQKDAAAGQIPVLPNGNRDAATGYLLGFHPV